MTDPAISKLGNLTLDVFNRTYCVVCGNRECSRSSANASAFDMRVLNWKKDLFESVPRAPEGDPSYDNIRAKKFLPMNKPVEINTYEVQITPEPRIPSVKIVEETPQLEISFDKPVLRAPQLATMPAQQASQQNLPFNTPFTHGVLIKNSEPESKESISEPGSTFTFNGSDNE